MIILPQVLKARINFRSACAGRSATGGRNCFERSGRLLPINPAAPDKAAMMGRCRAAVSSALDNRLAA